jgi:hypothetical protein
MGTPKSDLLLIFVREILVHNTYLEEIVFGLYCILIAELKLDLWVVSKQEEFGKQLRNKRIVIWAQHILCCSIAILPTSFHPAGNAESLYGRLFATSTLG